MSGDKPYTAAELKRREQDQADPRWLTWLAQMDDRVRSFLTRTASDIAADPWTTDALDYVEQIALQRFPNVDAVASAENRDLADQIHRYVGEVFRRSLEGQWYNVPDYDDEDRPRGFGPVIRLPFTDVYMDVIPLLTAAMDRRTGTYWSMIIGYQAEDHRAWIEARRPPLAEWIRIRR